ncbi:ATP-binding protein [Streptomyces phaeolivaceus]|uniref:ATP-binding protein n=1 Tax=Streptomyces phaeolivaceus TaxID=2653200 RepID=A0A5P8K309_9ACTN|nr:ATP-binding protein [Streptomyces phaeolivaceus]QFQ96989.1 ATP-binding protein [Streptomyces phaeolivaceus]
MSEGPRLRSEFRQAELPLVRALVEEAALRARFTTTAKGAFTQAALEICTYAVVHGVGPAVIRLRVLEGELRCEVTYDGAAPAAGPHDDGHGLRLAESLIAGLGAPGRIGGHRTPRGATVTLSAPLPNPVRTLPVPLPVTVPPAR